MLLPESYSGSELTLLHVIVIQFVTSTPMSVEVSWVEFSLAASLISLRRF